MTEYNQELEFAGILTGHNGWVTAISTPQDPNERIAVSASRDRKLILWNLDSGEDRPGYAKKSFTGHSHFVQDVVCSNDGQYAISGSWDKTLRLWDLTSGKTLRTFKGHTSDVLSVVFSADNRQIVSSSRDKTIKLWNTLSECKYTITDKQHTDWISSVKISPNSQHIVSGGWDNKVKVWDLQRFEHQADLIGHSSPVYSITISPDGSLCASGGKDNVAMLWDVSEGKHLYSLETNSHINALCFSPRNYWLCAATDKGVVIWDLENRNVLCELSGEGSSQQSTARTSLTWTVDGKTLLVGSTEGNIYVYDICRV